MMCGFKLVVGSCGEFFQSLKRYGKGSVSINH